MEEKITHKFAQMQKMLFTLERATVLYAAKLKGLSPDQYHENEDLLAYRDSVIQRLEYCVDGFWKFMKVYLEIVQGLVGLETGPKPIARTAALHHLISEQESKGLISMIEERNKTSHMYHEEIADQIANAAPKALALMKTILERLGQRLGE